MSNTDLIRHLRAEHAKHFDALGDLLFDAARALEAAEADRTYRLRTSSRTMTVVDENEVFVTLLDGGRPAFWEIREGRPVMLSYAVTAAGREPKPGDLSWRDRCDRRGWPHGEEQDGDNPCVCGEPAFHKGLHVCDDCGEKWAGGRAPEPEGQGA